MAFIGLHSRTVHFSPFRSGTSLGLLADDLAGLDGLPPEQVRVIPIVFASVVVLRVQEVPLQRVLLGVRVLIEPLAGLRRVGPLGVARTIKTYQRLRTKGVYYSFSEAEGAGGRLLASWLKMLLDCSKRTQSHYSKAIVTVHLHFGWIPGFRLPFILFGGWEPLAGLIGRPVELHVLPDVRGLGLETGSEAFGLRLSDRLGTVIAEELSSGLVCFFLRDLNIWRKTRESTTKRVGCGLLNLFIMWEIIEFNKFYC